jgi:hypothetical protein
MINVKSAPEAGGSRGTSYVFPMFFITLKIFHSDENTSLQRHVWTSIPGGLILSIVGDSILIVSAMLSPSGGIMKICDVSHMHKNNLTVIAKRLRIVSSVLLFSCIALPMVRTTSDILSRYDNYILIVKLYYTLYFTLVDSTQGILFYADIVLILIFCWPLAFVLMNRFVPETAAKSRLILSLLEIAFIIITFVYAFAYAYLIFAHRKLHFHAGSILALVSFALYCVSRIVLVTISRVTAQL